MQQTDKSTSYQGQWTQLRDGSKQKLGPLNFPSDETQLTRNFWQFQWFFNNKTLRFFKKIPPGQKTNKQKTTRQLKVKRSGISLKMIEGGVKLKSTRRQTRRICRRRLGSNISQKKKKNQKRNMLHPGPPAW